jgi:hypothetical protein
MHAVQKPPSVTRTPFLDNFRVADYRDLGPTTSQSSSTDSSELGKLFFRSFRLLSGGLDYQKWISTINSATTTLFSP